MFACFDYIFIKKFMTAMSKSKITIIHRLVPHVKPTIHYLSLFANNVETTISRKKVLYKEVFREMLTNHNKLFSTHYSHFARVSFDHVYRGQGKLHLHCTKKLQPCPSASVKLATDLHRGKSRHAENVAMRYEVQIKLHFCFARWDKPCTDPHAWCMHDARMWASV